jgi:hypothetical protein
MRKSRQMMIAFGCAAFLIAAGYAMRGEHGPTGNIGYLGHDSAGVFGSSPSLAGVLGSAVAADKAGVTGLNDNGDGANGFGLTGVYGFSPNVNGTGVWGDAAGSSSNAVGVYGSAPTTAWAGYFQGHLGTSGNLVKAAGSFRIDHPLDPYNKYLSHSFVESPDMMNLYSGTVILDGAGTAIVELPAWFQALNRDFRYQLTCIGEAAPVYIAEEIENNRFAIAGGHGSMKVSWQVIGTRKDPYATANPIVVETWKDARERGRLLHPEAYGQTMAANIRADREHRKALRLRSLPRVPRP